MAESNQATDPGERYAALELAYTEDRWPDVLREGESLIADLRATSDPLEAGLLSRAQLLLGHAHLYGLRNPGAARPYYQAVLSAASEPDLQQIAEAALPYCEAVASEPSETSPEPLSTAEAIAADEESMDAAPQESNAPQSTAADPEPAETLPTGSSGFLEAAATPISISTSEPSANNAAEALTTDNLLSTDQGGLSTDPFQSSSRQGPWIAPAPEAILQPEAIIQESATPWLDDMARQEQEMMLRLQKTAERKAARDLADRIDVDLVEEPEQLEVAQANPDLAEELDLALASHEEPAIDEELARLMEDPELVAGLLRVVLQP